MRINTSLAIALNFGAALILAACTTIDPTVPDRSFFARETVAVPQGEALCDDDGDGVLESCLSEAQGDQLFNDVVDALCAANDKLAFLDEYFHRVELGPSCGEVAG